MNMKIPIQPPVATTDFVDYANQDYRIQRNSALYKSNNGMNFGAIQNEDFEFVSVFQIMEEIYASRKI